MHIYFRGSVFGADSSEDEEKERKNINKLINEESTKKLQTKQTQLQVQRAVEEDPRVYEYDEVYDEMEEKRKSKWLNPLCDACCLFGVSVLAMYVVWGGL